jgi:hypothetical protein
MYVCDVLLLKIGYLQMSCGYVCMYVCVYVIRLHKQERRRGDNYACLSVYVWGVKYTYIHVYPACNPSHEHTGLHLHIYVHVCIHMHT